MALPPASIGGGRAKGVQQCQRLGRVAFEPSLCRYRSWVGHGPWQCSEHWKAKNLLERTAEAKPRIRSGETNHAFGQTEEPKGADMREREYVNGRKNHSYVEQKSGNEERKKERNVDAWKEIVNLYMRRWTTHGQQATLQAEYDRGISTGKSWREIGASLGQIAKSWERGR
jgi:hypothetical protein